MEKKTNPEYYIVSVRYENFVQIRDNGFSLIGFPAKSKMAQSLGVGDKLVLYIGSHRSKIAAILEIDSEAIWSNDLIWDDFYPTRYKTKTIKVLPKDKYLDMREVKNHLSFINPDIKKFGVYFMSGLKRISQEDYTYIKDQIDLANE